MTSSNFVVVEENDPGEGDQLAFIPLQSSLLSGNGVNGDNLEVIEENDPGDQLTYFVTY